MKRDLLKQRKCFRICGMAVGCIPNWMFAVAFALLVPSCTQQQQVSDEPKPEIILTPALVRRMQLEAEDIISVVGSQSLDAADRAKAKPKLDVKRKAASEHKMKVSRQEPAASSTCCEDFELTVSCGDWTLHIEL